MSEASVLDLHAYLGSFDPWGLKPLSDEWHEAGVGWIVGVGDDVATSEAAVEAAWSLPDTVAGVGLHPQRIGTNGHGDQLEALAELATDPQVAVISDVGVDTAVEASQGAQEEVFRAVLEIASQNSRSLLIHWHAPATRLLEIWGEIGGEPPRAAMLDFQGESAEMDELLDRGFYFSVSLDGAGAASGIPDERLFVHSSARPDDGTSGPPVVREVLEQVATQRGVDRGALALQINSNFWEFLAWRPK